MKNLWGEFPLFWDVTLYDWKIGCRRFGGTVNVLRFNSQNNQEEQRTFVPLKMKALRNLETSATSCPVARVTSQKSGIVCYAAATTFKTPNLRGLVDYV